MYARVSTSLLTAALLMPCLGKAAEPPSEAKASLLAAEQAFAASAESRDMPAFGSFLADNAVFAGGSQVLTGKEAIVRGWSPFFAQEGPRISWSPDLAVVLDDGSLGVTRGPYLVDYPDPDGGALHSEGTFFSVWRRQGDEWEVVLDTGVQCVPGVETDSDTDSDADPGQAEGAFRGLEWMVGTWRGAGLGGECEEVWSTSSGGAMMGMFRLIKDGQVSFYEIITITELEDRPHMRLKHFGADLVGWEERQESVEFPFVSKSSDTLVFEGIAYHKDGDDGLNIEVELNRTDDVSRRELLRLRRMD